MSLTWDVGQMLVGSFAQPLVIHVCRKALDYLDVNSCRDMRSCLMHVFVPCFDALPSRVVLCARCGVMAHAHGAHLKRPFERVIPYLDREGGGDLMFSTVDFAAHSVFLTEEGRGAHRSCQLLSARSLWSSMSACAGDMCDDGYGGVSVG